MNATPSHITLTSDTITKSSVITTTNPLRSCIKEMLKDYFNDLDGHPPGNLYELVMNEVEQPLLEIILDHTDGNQSKAAGLLGINRGTLRNKLSKHGLGK